MPTGNKKQSLKFENEQQQQQKSYFCHYHNIWISGVRHINTNNSFLKEHGVDMGVPYVQVAQIADFLFVKK